MSLLLKLKLLETNDNELIELSVFVGAGNFVLMGKEKGEK